ncbi:MAG: stage V sporulation protein E [Clostridiaceae bacterium]
MGKIKLQKVEVDFTLLATILVLVAFGVIMVFSASSYVALHSKDYNQDEFYFLKKQGLWALLGIAGMFIIQKIDYHIYRKYIKHLMLITLVLLIVVLFSKPINGAQRWINLGFTTIQPSEIAKYVVVLFLAHSISRKGDNMRYFVKGIVPYLLVSGFFAGLVLAEKNLSIATIIMSVTLIVLFVGGVNIKHYLMMIVGLIPLGVGFILFEPYRLKRLLSFLDPFQDPKGNGYQLIQSWYALSSGGLLGVGLGQSRQKAFFIPEPHNDFIFSVIGEELGLVGCIALIILFILLISRGIKVALNARDTYGTLLAIGITSVIAIQAIINIAVVSGSIPVTGVPLPFISSGGTSLFVNLLAMGILLNISSTVDKNKKINRSLKQF